MAVNLQKKDAMIAQCGGRDYPAHHPYITHPPRRSCRRLRSFDLLCRNFKIFKIKRSKDQKIAACGSSLY
ncbi:hypothetical protein, partial [Pseudomonas sp. ES3-33]|uniref:hypothetical protein n=1 Tax=Pseudomonas sp. ES3-33 TaxID=1628833 RepID=UPI001F2F05BA